MVAQAKAAGAEIVLVDAIPPQAIAIRKQMASAGYMPKLLVMEKGAEPEFFAQATGKLADGVLVGGYWDPSFPYPGAADLAKRFETETRQTQSQHIADSHAAAQVLLDAIAAAGSLDREKINAAIARTQKTYVVGPVKFDADECVGDPDHADAVAGRQGRRRVAQGPRQRQADLPAAGIQVIRSGSPIARMPFAMLSVDVIASSLASGPAAGRHAGADRAGPVGRAGRDAAGEPGARRAADLRRLPQLVR
jgi:hypothetical protein